MSPYTISLNYLFRMGLFQLSGLLTSSFQYLQIWRQIIGQKLQTNFFTVHSLKSFGTNSLWQNYRFLDSFHFFTSIWLPLKTVHSSTVTTFFTQHPLFFHSEFPNWCCRPGHQESLNSIPHDALLLKLWSVGICGSLWSWFNGYLLSRTHCVTVLGHRSDFLPVLSGVPQGRILGPLLFLVYFNDLPAATSFSTTLMFVDDTKCLKNIYSISDCLLLHK